MLYDIPDNWKKYLIPDTHKFMKNTPSDIISQARKMNDKIFKTANKVFYSFEEDEE